MRMRANAGDRSGSSFQRRWADSALTVLAVELAVTIFIIAPLAVLTPRSGNLGLPLVLAALVITPVLIAAVLVASSNGAAMAAVFVAIALFPRP